MRAGLNLGQYKGEVISLTEKRRRYPDDMGRYVMKLSTRLFIDGVDPRLSNFTRFINHASAPHTNVEAICSRREILFRTLRKLEPGEELFYDYGEAYEWEDKELQIPLELPKPQEPVETDLTRSREGLSSASSLPLSEEITKSLTDLPEDSMIAYFTPDCPDWKLGSLSCVDEEEKLVEVHRYGSYNRLTGTKLPLCNYAPVWVDPRDSKVVFTTKPLQRYEPEFDIVKFSDVITYNFYLTKAGKLHPNVLKLLCRQAESPDELT